MVRRLRSETTMTLDWIAQWLVMRVAGYAAQCLRESEGKEYAILTVTVLVLAVALCTVPDKTRGM
jgi:hypothetical protein